MNSQKSLTELTPSPVVTDAPQGTERIGVYVFTDWVRASPELSQRERDSLLLAIVYYGTVGIIPHRLTKRVAAVFGAYRHLIDRDTQRKQATRIAKKTTTKKTAQKSQKTNETARRKSSKTANAAPPLAPDNETMAAFSPTTTTAEASTTTPQHPLMAQNETIAPASHAGARNTEEEKEERKTKQKKLSSPLPSAVEERKEASRSDASPLVLDQGSAGAAGASVGGLPSRDEVMAHWSSQGWRSDAEAFFDYYEARGWTGPRGQRIARWRVAAANWERHFRDRIEPIRQREEAAAAERESVAQANLRIRREQQDAFAQRHAQMMARASSYADAKAAYERALAECGGDEKKAMAKLKES
ncbi:MAG: hypothetical protein HUK09_07185 [Bacteroidaceae bacterium]|nr:hypothetical protein [Bacteroidaceae bacterium]